MSFFKSIHKEIVNSMGDFEGHLKGFMCNIKHNELKKYLKNYTDLPLQIALMSETESILLIEELYVDEYARGCGHGSEMIERAMNESFSHNIETTMLICDTDETQVVGFDLKRFYEKHGFYQINKHRSTEYPIMIAPMHVAKDIEEALLNIEQICQPKQQRA